MKKKKTIEYNCNKNNLKRYIHVYLVMGNNCQYLWLELII